MRYIIILIALILTNGCNDYKIKSSSDPKAEFDKYTSWCWRNNCNPTFEGPGYMYPKPVMDNIVNSIAEEMYNKGYEQLDENSDLLVDFQVIFKEDSSKNAIVHEQSYPLWDNYIDSDLYYHYLVGTLIIDIADREQGKVIWRSVSERYLPNNPKLSQAEVKKGIKKALKEFPKRKKTETSN